MSEDARILSLRKVVKVSPEDIDLRVLLAETLLEAGLASEAEAEYKSALKIDASRDDLALGLARALGAQGRQDAGVAVLDGHVELHDPSADLLIEHARQLLAVNRLTHAAKSYQQAIALDGTVEDAFLARRLNVHSRAPQSPDPDRDAVPIPTGPGMARNPEDLVESERPSLTFASIGGMEALKEEIRIKIIHPLAHPELYEAYGKSIGGGILLYGPPGCGKTHLARATAGEVKANFTPVGIHDVLEMWTGQSERNLHAIFQQARNSQPSVLFFDEVDALGAARSDMPGASGRQTINQFLAELDGVGESNEGMLVLAATNAPWHLDNAFRRPGRFDRVIFVPPPDAEARARILEIMLQGKPVDSIDFGKLAKKTAHFSGADLKGLVDRAIEEKLRIAISAAKGGPPTPLTTKELLAAAKTIVPSTREWFATARNYVLYSNEGGLYDDVRAYLDIR